ncbi:MAG: signal peptidase II [Phenylobacterium sp.]|uniref:signal peptidase II n=1 Tax=Phenylobacterium sp. TaxID=1871053 RepID=UPI001A47C7EE|nr:signal peptidase II [Phenylobacterium sp.]MBL8772226.1 signal peptidase II [Phenylobacterium sp.]
MGLLLGAFVAVLDVVLNRKAEAVLSAETEHRGGAPFHVALTDLAHLGWAPAAALAVILALGLAGLALARTRLTAAAFGLVYGGAFGNLLDGAGGGRVWDLVSFHLPAGDIPLNVSDLSLLIGGGLLLSRPVRR